MQNAVHLHTSSISQEQERIMPLLQVRDFPADLYEVLKDTAKRDNRSVAQETIVLLRDSLDPKQEGIEKRKRVFAKLDEIHRQYSVDTSKMLDPVQLIREDRDR
jgi:hypothetical protein